MSSLETAYTSPAPISRAWYDASISEFLQTPHEAVLGRLATNGQFALLPTQRDAWLVQLRVLKTALENFSGSLFLEFNIPRVGRRIDVVVIIGPIVFVVEFKVGESSFDRAALDQVWDYALDLKNFHEASHHASIIPILVATEAATASPPMNLFSDEDRVYRPIAVGSDALRSVMDELRCPQKTGTK